MAKLSRKDKEYYLSIIREDKQEHRLKLMNKNLPEHVISAYEGHHFDRSLQDHDNETLNTYQRDGNGFYDSENRPENIIENWLFIAANTIIPTLYFQVPTPSIRNKPNGDVFSAEVLNGLIRHYFDEKAKVENQRAIIDAYLAYGIGIVKVGYNSRVGILKNKRSNLFTGEIKADGKDIDMESSIEYVKYERPFVERVSPRDCYLDWTKEFGKGQRATFRYDRTLQELMDSNLYPLDQRFVKFFGSKTGDNRKIRLRLKEHWTMINGFSHKVVFVDEWQEEILFQKTPYQWLPLSLLRFNQPSDTLYPRSHGSQANAAQDELNYLNELWKEHIDHARSQTLVDETGLAEGGSKTLHANEIGGIVMTNRPPNNMITNIDSTPMGQDTFANIQNVRAYLQQLLSAGGSISGDVSADTATQDRNQQLGNFLRTSGMQDAIRDFNNDQIRKMITCVVNWGSPEVTVTITGKNVQDPTTGELVTGRDLVIGGKEGIPLSELIIGNIESDYQYDVDMANAARPDFAVVRKQLGEALQLVVSFKPLINAEGKQIEITSLVEDYLKTFDTLPNVQKYIRDLTPEEQQQIALQQQQEQLEQTLKGASQPTEEALLRGAESTGVAQGAT